MAPRKQDTEGRNAAVAGETVVGLFADQPAAERGIQALTAAGFTEQQIGIAMRDKQQQEKLTEGTGTQAAEGAAAGAMGGGVLGGVVGTPRGPRCAGDPGHRAGHRGRSPRLDPDRCRHRRGGGRAPRGAGRHGRARRRRPAFRARLPARRRARDCAGWRRRLLARQALIASGADIGPAQAVSSPNTVTSENADRLQLHEEQLEVEKEPVQVGE